MFPSSAAADGMNGLQHYQQLPSTNCAIYLWDTLALIAIKLSHSKSAALCKLTSSINSSDPRSPLQGELERGRNRFGT